MHGRGFAEIELVGSLLPSPVEPGTTALGGRVKYERIVVEGNVLAAIDAAERDGIRVLLLVVDSPGGILRSGLAVFSRLRAFSDAGGTVLAYVLKAKSTAPLIAQAADFVCMAPKGTICLHGALADGPAYDRRADTSAIAGIMAMRTGMPVQRLAPFCREEDIMGVAHAAGSVRLGWADAICDSLDLMREHAALVAAVGRLPPAPWSRRRPSTGRAPTVASDAVAHDVQSSESDYSLPDPEWGSPASAAAVATKVTTFTQAAAPTTGMSAGDQWQNTDTTTACVLGTSCPGTLNTDGTQRSPASHRVTGWLHTYDGAAWTSGHRGKTIVVPPTDLQIGGTPITDAWISMVRPAILDEFRHNSGAWTWLNSEPKTSTGEWSVSYNATSNQLSVTLLGWVTKGFNSLILNGATQSAFTPPDPSYCVTSLSTFGSGADLVCVLQMRKTTVTFNSITGEYEMNSAVADWRGAGVPRFNLAFTALAQTWWEW